MPRIYDRGYLLKLLKFWLSVYTPLFLLAKTIGGDRPWVIDYHRLSQNAIGGMLKPSLYVFIFADHLLTKLLILYFSVRSLFTRAAACAILCAKITDLLIFSVFSKILNSYMSLNRSFARNLALLR